MPVFSVEQNKDLVESVMDASSINNKTLEIPSADKKNTIHIDSLEKRSGWIITGTFYFMFAKTQEKQGMIDEKQNIGLVFK